MSGALIVTPRAKIITRFKSLDTIQQIEQAIDTLTPEQLEELYLWLDDKYQQLADTRLKAAIDQGCFDQIIEQALEDDAAGRTTPL